MQRNRDSLQQRRLGKRQIVWQRVGNSRRQGDEFGKSSGPSIDAAGASQPLAVIAQVHLATAAKRTFAAIDGGVEGDAVSFLKVLYAGSNPGHSPRCFITH